MRRVLTIARAFELMLAYARQHRRSTRETEELARADGIVVPQGRLIYVGARWTLHETATTTRRFRVNLPRTGSRTVEVATRARLAVNLIELGYPSIQAGRHAYAGWDKGRALAGGNVVLTELTAGAE